MKDFAPTSGRTRVRGRRTKSAIRRARIRQERHRSREEQAHEARDKRRRADNRRHGEGWWPPKPIEGQPPPLPVPFSTGLRLRRGDDD